MHHTFTENCVLWQFFPLSDACDPSWRLSRDAVIIAGFVVSSLVLILAITQLLGLYYLGKQVRNYNFKCSGTLRIGSMGF